METTRQMKDRLGLGGSDGRKWASTTSGQCLVVDGMTTQE